MLHTDGIPPKLTGRECQELLCQQYHQYGELVNEVDVLFIKSHDHWYELYFENDTVFWRAQDEAPAPFKEQENDPFTYPLIDMGIQYGLKDQIILACETASMADGAKVTFLFEKGDKVIVSCVENQTRVQHIKER